jgi:hypothetical protein
MQREIDIDIEGQGIAIATEEPPHEKRRTRRTKMTNGVQVAWNHSKGFFISDIADLGLGGTFIVTLDPLPVGASLKLLFEAPGKEIQASAVVRRSLPGRGMGVEFTEMDLQDRDCLHELLEASGSSESRRKSGSAAPQTKHPKPSLEPAHQAPAPAAGNPPVAAVPHARGSERRSHLRYEFSVSAEIMAGESGKPAKAQIDNLSRGGCYLKTAGTHHVGAVLTVKITKDAATFQAQARVTSSTTGKGMGMEFKDLDAAQLQILDSWLETVQGGVWLSATRRKGQHMILVIPIQVTGINARGSSYTETASTVSISAHGALISMGMALEKGQRVKVLNLITKEEVECTVVHIGQAQGNQFEMGIAFNSPCKAFWKVAFPPSNWSRSHPDAKKTQQSTSKHPAGKS